MIIFVHWTEVILTLLQSVSTSMLRLSLALVGNVGTIGWTGFGCGLGEVVKYK